MTPATFQRLRKPLIWMLLPVALLTGRPMVGCICSDGTYKVSCEKLVGSCRWLQAMSQNGRSCCSTPNVANTQKCPTCQEPANNSSEAAGAPSQCHCRGMENNLTLRSSRELERNRESAFAVVSVSEIHSGAAAIPHDLRSPLRNDLPPPDRIVLFLHLTI